MTWELDMRGYQGEDYFFKYAVRLIDNGECVCINGFDTLNQALNYLETQTLTYKLVV